MKQSIKSWYQTNFPNDDLASDLADIAFADLWLMIQNGYCVYEYANVPDSIVRENLFSQLAKLLNVKYSYIYNTWLNN